MEAITKAELCRSLGADLVVDHTQEDFVEAVFEATDEVGAHVVCDLAGGDFVAKSWQCTAREGRYLAIGFADGDEVHAELLRLIADGSVRPHVGRVVSMDDAGAALDDHEQRRSIGRTVVAVAGS